MKKLLLKICSIFISLLTLVIVLKPTKNVYADTKHDNLVISLDASINNNQVIVTAKLAKNSGISSLLLTLSYDTNNLQLVNCTRGNALAKLDYVQTGNYNEYPFKLYYDWNTEYASDNSTGVLATFTFNLKEGCSNGTYQISFVNSQSEYIDNDTGERFNKTVLSDKANVTISNSNFTDISLDEIDVDKDINTTLIIILSVVGSIALITTTYFVIKLIKKRKTNWVKIDEESNNKTK